MILAPALRICHTLGGGDWKDEVKSEVASGVSGCCLSGPAVYKKISQSYYRGLEEDWEKQELAFPL